MCKCVGYRYVERGNHPRWKVEWRQRHGALVGDPSPEVTRRLGEFRLWTVEALKALEVVFVPQVAENPRRCLISTKSPRTTHHQHGERAVSGISG